jgi:hypothetical protein
MEMSKPVSKMTTEEVRAEMSIAGDPDRIIGIMQNILREAAKAGENYPELVNLELAMERVLAEVRFWKKMSEERTNNQIG